MRVISCHLENFASYKELDFTFKNQGLTLIQGPTGAGKSTLCDAIPWVLFGRTAKDGAVDEVRSWGAEGPTRGEIEVKAGQHIIKIVRSRAPNDLWYQLIGFGGDQVRGKDLNDTQRLINIAVGMDVNLYLSGAYFHEFSQTAQFFTTTAKNRRAICDQLVDLSLAKTLTERLNQEKKTLKQVHDDCSRQINHYFEKIADLKGDIETYEAKALTFEEDKEAQLRKIAEETVRLDEKIKPEGYFNKARRKLQDAETALGSQTCGECGAPMAHEGLHGLSQERSKLRLAEQQSDNNRSQKARLEQEFDRLFYGKNEFGALVHAAGLKLKDASAKQKGFVDKLFEVANALADTELLLDVVNDYRSATITSTISHLEAQTNRLLSEHFDAEIKVMFEVADADKLDVVIFKDGNQCVYTQLSKGQRQLLKLCFGISVMQQVSNRHGLSFNCLFFDESLDGLSDQLKLKALGLFKTLELLHESIFVVEHSAELKAAFDNQLTVTLKDGNSVISNG